VFGRLDKVVLIPLLGYSKAGHVSPRIDQSNTNFCWVFSVAVNSEISR
jgi:hypothetical protein